MDFHQLCMAIKSRHHAYIEAERAFTVIGAAIFYGPSNRVSEHQRPSKFTRPLPEGSIQRRLSPRQLVSPSRSIFQCSQRPQNSSCGSSWTEPALPVALLASGVLLQVHRYGGPLAERDSDASTRSVTGGITTVRSCIA